MGSPAQAATDTATAIVQSLREQDAAMLRVGERLVVGGAALCGGSGHSAGMLVQSLAQYRKDLRPAAQADLGLATRPTITLVAPGGAAETAGIRPRDVIAAVDGHVFAEDGDNAGKSFATTEAAHDAIEAALTDGTATFDLLRDGRPTQVKVAARPACRVRFDVRAGKTSTLLGRFADAGTDYVRVRQELIGQTRSDGELAAILAHEMSHIVLRHAERLRTKTARLSVRDAEIEADRLSVYLMDAAGYPPADAVAFYTRWGPTTDLGVFSDRSHPGWQKRVATIEAEAQAIAAMKAARQPVQPPADLRLAR